MLSGISEEFVNYLPVARQALSKADEHTQAACEAWLFYCSAIAAEAFLDHLGSPKLQLMIFKKNYTNTKSHK
jgi:hypothetical protein